MAEVFKKTKLFAFDLDGTIYLGDKAISGSIELIDYLRTKYDVVFFTNNSSKTRTEVCEKLKRLGIENQPDEVYTSCSSAVDYLNEMGINNVYVIGSEGFQSELQGNNITVVDNDTAENLVVGLDFDFSYERISNALTILSNGGQFIVCNEDGSFPVEGHRRKPGCGAMVGAISASSNVRPHFVVGKPNTYILSQIAQKYEVKQDEIVVVGDSYESDIQMAINYDCRAILVNSKDLVKDKNVMIMNDLHEILESVKEDKI